MADDGLPAVPTRGPSLKPQPTTLDRKEQKGKLFGGKKDRRECFVQLLGVDMPKESSQYFVLAWYYVTVVCVLLVPLWAVALNK